MQSNKLRLILRLFAVFTLTVPTGLHGQGVPPVPQLSLSQDQQPQIIRSAPLSELPSETSNPMPGCISNAQSGYSDKKCVIYINRLAPISPPPQIVPKGTTVYVVVYNTRWNEAVTFSSALSKTTTPDIAAAVIKNAGTPLQSIVLAVTKSTGPGRFGLIVDLLGDWQEQIKNQLNSLQISINHANAALTCLSNYEQIVDAAIDPGTGLPSKYSCSQANLLNPTTFAPVAASVLNEATNAGQATLPIMLIKKMDNWVDVGAKDCITPPTPPTDKKADQISDAETESSDDDCKAIAIYMSNRVTIDSALTAIQTAQASLMQSVRALNAWPGTPTNVAYEFVSQRSTNLILTITGQEIINKVASPIATVAINTQANPFVLSTGLGFSNLKYFTYTAAPVIGPNGNPVLDSSGKATTIVTQQSQSPSVIAPLVLASVRIMPISRAKWENKCPNGCSFLVSGGIGANLTTKTADFDLGPSFQLGSFLLTPTVHFGRYSRLTNGVQVGQMLGSSPPSTLPTQNYWVIKWAVALTYSIPIT